MSHQTLVRFAATIGIVALLCGCPNPNTYGTPRTIPKGKLNHTFALEGVYLAAKLPDPKVSDPNAKKDYSIVLPTLPSYYFRYGVIDRLDVGVSFRNMSTLGGDVKFNPLKTPVFDLAINPGVQYLYLASAHLLYVHLPVIGGINVGDKVTLVPTLGAVYAALLADGSNLNDNQKAVSGSGVFARAGGGINFRVSRHLALHPEVTLMQGFNDSSATFGMFGLGISLGPQPNYGSEDEESEQQQNVVTPTQPITPAPAPMTPTSPTPPPANPAPEPVSPTI